jgi:PAS domain-containing protein
LQRELTDSVRQTRYMAQNASIGMQYISIDGRILWANDKYYAITGHPQEPHLQHKLSFIYTYIEQDQPKARDVWTRLLNGEKNVSMELRLKQKYKPPVGDPEPACVLMYVIVSISNCHF